MTLTRARASEQTYAAAQSSRIDGGRAGAHIPAHIFSQRAVDADASQLHPPDVIGASALLSAAAIPSMPATADLTSSNASVARDAAARSQYLRPQLSDARSALYDYDRGTARHPLALSGWLLARASGQHGLSDTGQLGGSQVGIRAYYALGSSPISLTARFSAPLSDPRGKESAFGVALRPSRTVPITIIVEQRVAADRGGRNDLEALVAAGVSDHPLGHGLTLSGYAQAGMVGVKSRDAFVDGAAQVEHPLLHINGARVTLGTGVWGAAQPGLMRLDAGPTLAIRLRAGRIGIRAEASYRVRMSGAVRPSTGPALSIGTDF